jgi:hypothetical protein
MDTIKYILMGTPWWVYVLLVVMVKAGLRAAKGGVVPLLKLLILPVVFAVFAVQSWLSGFSNNALFTQVFIGSMVIAAILGWVYVRLQKIRVDRKHWRIDLPGTWTTMVVIVIIFASNYYFGYKAGVDPAIIKNATFDVAQLIVSGLCTGYVVGRALAYFYKMYTQESVDLT